MKTTILHLLSLLAILSFSGSCGKKDEKSSTAPVPVLSPLNLNASGEAALANLHAWYDSQSEGPIPSLVNGLVARRIYRNERTLATSNGCEDKPIKVFGKVISYVNVCGSINTNGFGTEVSELATMLVSGNKKIENPKLALALASVLTPDANGLKLTSIEQSPSNNSGTLFVITYSNVTTHKEVIQVIDTGFNSRVNPIYTYDGVNGKETSLTRITNF